MSLLLLLLFTLINALVVVVQLKDLAALVLVAKTLVKTLMRRVPAAMLSEY